MLTLLVKTNVGRVFLLAIVGFVVYVAWLQPTWAMGPLRNFAERWLLSFGAGLAPAVLWVVVFTLVWRYRIRLLFRQWRLVFGSVGLVVGAMGILAYFDGMLPLVGRANLGGEYGLRIQGERELLGYARIGGVLLLSLWVIGPNRSGGPANLPGLLLLRMIYGLGLVVRVFILLGRGLIRIPLLRPASWLAARMGRGRRARAASDLVDELGDFLSSTPVSEQSQRELSAAQPRVLALAKTPSRPKPASSSKPSASVLATAVKQSTWQHPPLDLLNPSEAPHVVDEELSATARLIEESLAQHGVEVRVAEVRPGPTVTMFGLVPGWNRRGKVMTSGGEAAKGADTSEGRTGNRVKVDSILAREKDLALSLAAPSLRIQAPVPGESVVGVEVPNQVPAVVSIRSVMESDAYQRLLERGGLPVALGQASVGESVAIDLLNMPHLLIAGATGSGKSVCINSVITSLITHQDPSKVRLLLVDPKRVELTPYNGIPHLIVPVLVEPERVVRLLKGAIHEMLRRYRLLEEAGVRNIQSYTQSAKATEALPYLVICIDELADLMMTSAYDVEQSICRLAQLGRATGIHLVVATQRPSVDVVTGLIKANFPSRISFAVASQVDSRTILDSAGAERLLGRGDMLFLSPTDAKPRRVQGVYVSEDEAESMADHWRRARGGPVPEIDLESMAYEAEATAAETDFADRSGDGQDSLFDQAVQLAVANRQLSTSLLQRRLRIGYPRAARLMDQLEDKGVVSPSNELGKPRDVIYRAPER
jgi:S-DNA-T family DNA segregation ATPase FtsK/SpoIIIE